MRSRAFLTLGVFASLLALLLAAVLTDRYAREVSHRQAFRHLETMLLLRESKLGSYLESLQSEITLWSAHENIGVFMQELNASAQESAQSDKDARTGNQTGAREYLGSDGDVTAATEARLQEFAEYHHYSDVYFISLAGNVLFTVKKQADFKTNLLHGAYQSTGLGQVFREAMAYEDADSLAFTDFANYAPRDNLPAAFLASRIHTGAHGR